MKQFKALIRKEWQTHRGSMLIPLWFTGAVYVTGLLGLIINLIKEGKITIMTGGYKVSTVDVSMGLYGVSSALMAILGAVSIITTIILADSMINGAFKRKCEILHLSQPVSMLKVMSAKYGLLILGSSLLMAILGLINSLVMGSVLNFWIPVNLYYAMVGWAQSSIAIFFSLLLVASYYWLSAAVFKRKSFFMGTLVIIGIEILISVLNYTAGLGIPSLMAYVGSMVSIQVHVEPQVATRLGLDLDRLIGMQWQNVLSWTTLLKVLYSAIFFAGGYWFYSRRELS